MELNEMNTTCSAFCALGQEIYLHTSSTQKMRKGKKGEVLGWASGFPTKQNKSA